jgi:hypothetical protein
MKATCPTSVPSKWVPPNNPLPLSPLLYPPVHSTLLFSSPYAICVRTRPPVRSILVLQEYLLTEYLFHATMFHACSIPVPGESPVPSAVEGRQFLPIPLTPLFCYSSTLFCATVFYNCFRFNCFRTLSQKPPEVGTPTLPLCALCSACSVISVVKSSPTPLHLSGRSFTLSAFRKGPMSRVVVPSPRRWSSVVFQWKTLSISFPFMSLLDFLLHNEGGYTPHPSHED